MEPEIGYTFPEILAAACCITIAIIFLYGLYQVFFGKKYKNH